jgi:hypothetical protein
MIFIQLPSQVYPAVEFCYETCSWVVTVDDDSFLIP